MRVRAFAATSRRLPLDSGTTVSGPRLEPRPVGSLSAGVNVAQRFAERVGRTATFHVRDGEGRSRYWVERESSGVVTRPATHDGGTP